MALIGNPVWLLSRGDVRCAQATLYQPHLPLRIPLQSLHPPATVAVPVRIGSLSLSLSRARARARLVLVLVLVLGTHISTWAPAYPHSPLAGPSLTAVQLPLLPQIQQMKWALPQTADSKLVRRQFACGPRSGVCLGIACHNIALG